MHLSVPLKKSLKNAAHLMRSLNSVITDIPLVQSGLQYGVIFGGPQVGH